MWDRLVVEQLKEVRIVNNLNRMRDLTSQWQKDNTNTQ